jgi:hypothetical protein
MFILLTLMLRFKLPAMIEYLEMISFIMIYLNAFNRVQVNKEFLLVEDKAESLSTSNNSK